LLVCYGKFGVNRFFLSPTFQVNHKLKFHVTSRSSTSRFAPWTVFKSQFCGFAAQKYSTKLRLKNCRLARRYVRAMLKYTESLSWKSGNCREVATIELTDQEIVNATGINIVSGSEEGLGEWLAVGGEISTGDQVEIIRYKDSPNPNDYIIRIDFEANINLVVALVFKELGLSLNSVKWQCPELTLHF
jgi:hypothetical protein